MSGTRSYEFITGIETSTLPNPSVAVNDSDIMSKGQSDSTYTPKSDVYGNVADINALKAIASADRFDGQICFVIGLDLFYKFDAASTGTPDNDLIVQPNSGTGRWLKIVFSGGGGSGGGSGIEMLLQKTELEKSGLFTEALDNSLSSSGMVPAFTESVVAKLLKDTASSATSLELSFNPIYVEDADKDTNSAASWVAVAQGTNLTTSATKQIGSASLSFDKGSGGSEAGIRIDRGSQNFALAANDVAQFYINLPSITNLSDVYIKIFADTTSNYRKYVATTDVSGTALATGWNLMRFDLSNTAGSSVGGSGWDISKLSRYVEIGVDTSTGGQTYTAILVDSIMFSLSDPYKLGFNGSEITLYDTSNKQEVILDISNTLFDTRLALKSGQSLANSYTGGTVSAAAAKAERMVLHSANGIIGFNTALSSGTISTAQETRLQRYLRESISMNMKVVVDSTSPQYLANVTAVGGSTVDIEQATDLSANWANGDSVYIHRPVYSADGVVHYDLIATKSLTASSTHSGSTTVLTVNPSGIAVNDVISKNHLSVSQSLVASSSNESFTSMSVDTAPNGVQVVDNYFSYPNHASISGNFSLGGSTASVNKKGTMPSLSIAGSLNSYDSFLHGQFSTSGYVNGTNFRYIPSSASSYFNSATGWDVLIWAYIGANDGTTRVIMSNFSSPNTGWGIFRRDSTSQIGFYFATTQTDYVNYIPNAWNLIYVHGKNGAAYFNVNGVQSIVNTGSNTDLTQNITIGDSHAGLGSSLLSTDKLADLTVFSGGSGLSAAQVSSIYNGGNYRPFNQGGLRHSLTQNGLSGQKMSVKAKLQTTTTAVNPSILKIAAIKS